MKFTLLGTGTSWGVPVVGCNCEVCTSKDSKDKRFRCAMLIEDEDSCVLVDCGPDIRQQTLRIPFRRINAVLLTHIHYDHVGGIDDLRPYCRFGDIDIYAKKDVVEGLKRTMPYCFTEKLYPGVPHLMLHEIKAHESRSFGSINIVPINVMHGKLSIFGYRFGKVAYLTDMKYINMEEYTYLKGIEILFVNALRFERPHHSHQLVDDAIAFSREIGAKRTIFIHLTHDIGVHKRANKRLPKGFEFGYDGQVVEI